MGNMKQAGFLDSLTCTESVRIGNLFQNKARNCHDRDGFSHPHPSPLSHRCPCWTPRGRRQCAPLCSLKAELFCSHAISTEHGSDSVSSPLPPLVFPLSRFNLWLLLVKLQLFTETHWINSKKLTKLPKIRLPCWLTAMSAVYRDKIKYLGSKSLLHLKIINNKIF